MSKLRYKAYKTFVIISLEFEEKELFSQRLVHNLKDVLFRNSKNKIGIDYADSAKGLEREYEIYL